MLVHRLEAADARIVEAVVALAHAGADLPTCIAAVRRLRRQQWATTRRQVDHQAGELDRTVLPIEAERGDARVN